jgi:hypothetical protein
MHQTQRNSLSRAAVHRVLRLNSSSDDRRFPCACAAIADEAFTEWSLDEQRNPYFRADWPFIPSGNRKGFPTMNAFG